MARVSTPFSLFLVSTLCLGAEARCVKATLKVSDKCDSLYFGEKCEHHCNCLKEIEECDNISGCCESGCAQGYTAVNCSVRLAGLTDQPTSPWQTSYSIRIKFRQWIEDMGGQGPVMRYAIQYKHSHSSDWIWGPEVSHKKGVDFNEITVSDLQSYSTYEFSVLPIIVAWQKGFESPSLTVKTLYSTISVVMAATLAASILCCVATVIYFRHKLKVQKEGNDENETESQPLNHDHGEDNAEERPVDQHDEYGIYQEI